MMNSVVRGSVEDVPQYSQVSHQLSVNEELVDEVELWVDDHLRGGNEESQRKIEPVSDPAQTLQHRLSEKMF